MLARRFAQVFGAVYLLVGIAGFIITTAQHIGFASTHGADLLFFSINPLHNVIHVAVGAIWLAVSGSEARSRAASITFGAVYLVVGVLGFALIGSSFNILALNMADNGLHLVTAVLALAVGFAGSRSRVPALA